MSIHGADNTPKPTEIHILSKLDNSDKAEKISMNSIIEDLRITKEESKILGLKREYDLTKQEDIEAFNKDMKFEENGISINDMLENVKKQKKEAQNTNFGIDDKYTSIIKSIKDPLSDKRKLTPKLSAVGMLLREEKVPEEEITDIIKKEVLKNYDNVKVSVSITKEIEINIEGKTKIIINSGIINPDYSVEYHNEDGSIEKYDKNGNLLPENKIIDKPEIPDGINIYPLPQQNPDPHIHPQLNPQHTFLDDLYNPHPEQNYRNPKEE